MAKIGFEYIVSGVLGATSASGKTATYTGGRYWGKASTFNGTPTANDAKDYGDDGIAETDTSVTGGTLSAELNERTLELYAELMGHTLDETKKEIIANSNDIAPYVGVGAVGKSIRNNGKKFTAKFYYKVQFKEPNDENATKQENTTFTHTTLEGNMFMLENGDWKSEAEFETLQEAKAWLDKKVGITAEA